MEGLRMKLRETPAVRIQLTTSEREFEMPELLLANNTESQSN